MEIGPYRVKDEDTLVENEGSWHEFANLLFVDNPVGTGFSYVDTNKFIHELDEMADNFVTFLEKFFEMFPHYEEDDVSPATHHNTLVLTKPSFTLPESLMPASTFPTLRARSSTETKRPQARNGIFRVY